METYYNETTDRTIELLETNKDNGLSASEAKKRIEKHGHNKLTAKEGKTFIQMFFAQFKSFMIIILLIAAVVSGVVGLMEGEGLLDTYVILGILIVNAWVGAYQEKKAESSLEALKNLSAPNTNVLRDGEVQTIPSEELVPGDMVILETGEIVPADLRIIEAVNLKIQESSLTGESLPVQKQDKALEGNEDVALGDRINMAFSTGVISYGRGKGVVVATGMNTEVGKIADMLGQTDETKTPMSLRLEQLGKVLGIAALVISAVIFLVGILYGNPVMTMFMTAVTLAVAAIPEGLPAVSTVVLAIGVQRMVKRNAIVRNLPSVEALGSATVICSDKTGTLTQNKMTVVKAYVEHQSAGFDDLVADDQSDETLKHLITIAVLCTDAQVVKSETGEVEYTGDPTETALLEAGTHFELSKKELEKEFPRVGEIPFDSERKRMTTLNEFPENKIQVNVKGGLDEILSVCTFIRIKDEIRALTSEDKEKIEQANLEMAGDALRVLAMGYKILDKLPDSIDVENVEQELIFAGMLGMIDPARPEVIEAVKRCITAGIRPIMITGDHKITAMAIAREVGIFKEGDQAITGTELQAISQEEYEKTVDHYSVYARVAPEHKVRIVKAWQKNNEVVAMTGDGVNDAPALKQADIGAAMGIVGTDVAKDAADMVLTDDNFATIVVAVEEGRRIYDNILKAIQFLLSTNVGEIFLILVASVANIGLPLLPVHILWVNLVTDSLPALALAVDPPEEGIMERKPITPKQGFMTKGMTWRVIYQGLVIGAISLAAYIIGLREGGVAVGRTMAFSTVVFAQLLHVRNLHSNTRSSFATNPLKNKPLIGAILVSAGLALIVLLVPVLREAFSFSIMNRSQWITILLLSLVPIAVVELFKLLRINGK